MITLSELQQQAVDTVLDWFTSRTKDQQVFRLFGYAGTGKTTIAKTIASAVLERGNSRRVRFAAYTGKAASVLSSKGCTPASTVHSLIYRPKGEDEKGQPIFEDKWEGLHESTDQMVILDECSMINQEIGLDLLARKVPVLVLGDPAQLPPVGGAGYFTSATPDVLLTEIHRQAGESGILRIATEIRSGRRVAKGDYGDAKIVGKDALRSLDLLAFDQVLVGTNNKRRAWNKSMRADLGFTGELPEPGDKLICLRNNYIHRIMNGELLEVISVDQPRDDGFGNEGMSMEITCNGTKQRVWVDTHYLRGKEGNPPFTGGGELFVDFGYAITVHKSQGSQWDSVFVYDESHCFRSDAARWLYTGVTRAAKELVLMRGGF